MKLKYKLAEEYKPDSACIEELHFGCVARDAYLAGFGKAREMACGIEWNAAGNSEQLHKFKEMGEEELEE